VPQRKVAISKAASSESSSLQFPKAQDKPLAKHPHSAVRQKAAQSEAAHSLEKPQEKAENC